MGTAGIRRPKINNRGEAIIAAWRWGDALATRAWRGVGGSGERCCAEALLYWALRRGGIVFVASIDEISIEAGLSRSATRRALRRLCGMGLVGARKVGSGRRASEWELLPCETEGDTTGCVGGAYADWTRWGRVGKSAFLTWRTCIGGARDKDVAEGRQITIKHARRVLRELEARGLVQRVGDYWVAAEPEADKEDGPGAAARGARENERRNRNIRKLDRPRRPSRSRM